jgi:hypothetical protein
VKNMHHSLGAGGSWGDLMAEGQKQRWHWTEKWSWTPEGHSGACFRRDATDSFKQAVCLCLSHTHTHTPLPRPGPHPQNGLSRVGWDWPS